MPMSMLAGDGNAYREQLLSLGLIMAPGKFARDALHEYISTARPSLKARCVGRIGWHDKTYVRLHRNFGEHDGAEKFILQTTGAVDHAYRESGALEGWQTDVARYAIGNSRLGLALSAAFAAPLLHPTNLGVGRHPPARPLLDGKTTLLRPPDRSWAAAARTASPPLASHVKWPRGRRCPPLRRTAVPRRDGRSGGREAGQIAYMLANGIGKTRAGRSGEARPHGVAGAVPVVAGTGLADKIAEDGRAPASRSGQQVRIVEFRQIRGRASVSSRISTATRRATRWHDISGRRPEEHYGVASNAFLEFLTRDLDAIVSTVWRIRRVRAEELPADADGQVARVAARFGLITAAGEVATAFGILPWPSGEATRSAARCFRDWLGERGGIEPAEVREGIAAVRRYIELHGASRFEPISSLAPTTVIASRSTSAFRIASASRGEARTAGWNTYSCGGLEVGGVPRARRHASRPGAGRSAEC